MDQHRDQVPARHSYQREIRQADACPTELASEIRKSRLRLHRRPRADGDSNMTQMYVRVTSHIPVVSYGLYLRVKYIPDITKTNVLMILLELFFRFQIIQNCGLFSRRTRLGHLSM